MSVEVDGQQLDLNEIRLANDGQTHKVKVILGATRLREPERKSIVLETEPQGVSESP
jgi:hypothetical protein